MSDQEYIVKVKREHWASMPDNWIHAMSEMEGVEVVSEDSRFRMMRIRADESAVQRLRREFEGWLHIEERSDHDTRD